MPKISDIFFLFSLFCYGFGLKESTNWYYLVNNKNRAVNDISPGFPNPRKDAVFWTKRSGDDEHVFLMEGYGVKSVSEIGFLKDAWFMDVTAEEKVWLEITGDVTWPDTESQTFCSLRNFWYIDSFKYGSDTIDTLVFQGGYHLNEDNCLEVVSYTYLGKINDDYTIDFVVIYPHENDRDIAFTEGLFDSGRWVYVNSENEAAYLYMFGGMMCEKNCKNSVESMYNFSDCSVENKLYRSILIEKTEGLRLSWIEIELIGDENVTSRSHITTFVMGTKAYLFGGENRLTNEVFSDLYSFEIGNEENSTEIKKLNGNLGLESGGTIKQFGRIDLVGYMGTLYTYGGIDQSNTFSSLYTMLRVRLTGTSDSSEFMKLDSPEYQSVAYASACHKNYEEDLYGNLNFLFNSFYSERFFIFGGERENGFLGDLILVKPEWEVNQAVSYVWGLLKYYNYVSIPVLVILIFTICCVCSVLFFVICSEFCRLANTKEKNKKTETFNSEFKHVANLLRLIDLSQYEKKFKKKRVILSDLDDIEVVSSVVKNKIHQKRLVKESQKYVQTLQQIRIKNQMKEEEMKDVSLTFTGRKSASNEDLMLSEGSNNDLRSLPPQIREDDGEKKSDDNNEEKKTVLEGNIINPKMITIHSTIASGAFGVVRRGVMSIGLGELPVAVKEVVIGNQMSKLDDLKKEVAVMAEMKHENVLQTFGWWHDTKNNSAYIVMELCEKGDLFGYKSKINRLEKHDFLLQMAKGMEHLHSKDIVHRDFKTQNVLVNGKNIVKICDFGTSRHTKSVAATFCGTVEYLAPEQYDTTLISPDNDWKSVDIYAFGIIIWELFTEDTPFKDLREKLAGNQFEMLNKIHKQNMRPPLDKLKKWNLDEDLLTLMEDCWKHDPSHRPDSFSVIVEELTEIIKKEKEIEKEKSQVIKERMSQLEDLEKELDVLKKKSSGSTDSIGEEEPSNKQGETKKKQKAVISKTMQPKQYRENKTVEKKTESMPNAPRAEMEKWEYENESTDTEESGEEDDEEEEEKVKKEKKKKEEKKEDNKKKEDKNEKKSSSSEEESEKDEELKEETVETVNKIDENKKEEKEIESNNETKAIEKNNEELPPEEWEYEGSSGSGSETDSDLEEEDD